jgi:cytochrome c556
MHRLSRSLLVGAIAIGTLLATRSLAAPVDDVRIRVAGLREMGAAFKAVKDGLATPSPQTILIQMSARQIVNSSRDQYRWFPVGSGPQPGVKTRAKADIWANPAKFKQAQDALAAQAVSFQSAAATGDVGAIRAQFAKLGQTCKSCHDEFRSEEH